MRYQIALNLLLVLFLIATITSCNKNKFDSLEDFKKDIKLRKETIAQTLIQNNIRDYDTLIIEYIDYVFTSSERYNILYKQNFSGEFNTFIKTAIPVLYYSYSLKNYKKTPSILRKKV